MTPTQPMTPTHQSSPNQMIILSPQNLAPNFGAQPVLLSTNHTPVHTATPFSQGDIGGLFPTPQSQGYTI